MTDKVQKIREEVERLKEWQPIATPSLNKLLSFIDSMQEEPVSIDFEQELYKAFGQVKDFTLGMRIAKRFYEMGRNHQEPVSEEWIKELMTKLDSMSKEDFKKVFDKYAVDFNEESVSEDLDIAIGEYCSNPDNFITYIDVAFAYRSEQKDDIPLIVKAIKFGANWQLNKIRNKYGKNRN